MEKLRKQILSEVLDLLREENWDYIDRFPFDVSTVYLGLLEKNRRHPSSSTLSKSLAGIRSSFFRINSINRKNFSEVLSLRISERITIEIPTLSAKESHSDFKAMRLYVDDFDTFSKTKQIDTQDTPDVSNIYEQTVKLAFAEIIGESFVPKDSGSEKSDLYTSRVILHGLRRSAAFLLKGKSVRGTMRMKDLGKAGNQILRLLTEPVDIYFVQFVGPISTDVIQHLKNETELKSIREYRNLFYCVIDGADTARILKAYGKLS